jgi:hypothetical protein
MPGFGNVIKNVDVGLPYDLIQGTLEIGLWSSAFLERLRKSQDVDLSKMSVTKIFSTIYDLCRLSRNCLEPELLCSKDVYGSGVKRQVYKLEQLGIKKYRGPNLTGGRP